MTLAGPMQRVRNSIVEGYEAIKPKFTSAGKSLYETAEKVVKWIVDAFASGWQSLKGGWSRSYNWVVQKFDKTPPKKEEEPPVAQTATPAPAQPEATGWSFWDYFPFRLFN